MRQMLGSVSVTSRCRRRRCRTAPAGGNRIGLLGADYEIVDNKYRFKKVYRTTPYSSPAGSFGATLTSPASMFVTGDYLLQTVNDQTVEREERSQILRNAVNVRRRSPSRRLPTAQTLGVHRFPANGENRLRRANGAEEGKPQAGRQTFGRQARLHLY